MDESTWVQRFATALATEPPDEAEKAALLSLASVAANASERIAAPISCWIVAKSGRSPEEALAVARELASAHGAGS
ncbi:MAG TPA: DUF6457 domain-containing protein [Acidimicrobiales bacterium]|nr:DUF6457 domain-containing protein [Acidimicrobiales bacterium]